MIAQAVSLPRRRGGPTCLKPREPPWSRSRQRATPHPRQRTPTLTTPARTRAPPPHPPATGACPKNYVSPVYGDVLLPPTRDCDHKIKLNAGDDYFLTSHVGGGAAFSRPFGARLGPVFGPLPRLSAPASDLGLGCLSGAGVGHAVGGARGPGSAPQICASAPPPPKPQTPDRAVRAPARPARGRRCPASARPA
jgi:hypothetical protein